MVPSIDVVTRRQTMMAEMQEMGLDPMEEIRALGYEFHDGRLRQIGKDAGFVFQGRSHYDSLSEAVAQYVPLLLEEEANLNPLWLPLGVSPGDGCPIFVSEGYKTARQLLLIIQGAGKVRAGVWGCSLCINESLEQGTVLPHVRRAIASGYGVIVFNPNHNTADGVTISGSENFSNHVAYVMENVGPQCAASKIDILAHSQGGRALLSYVARAWEDNAAMRLVRRIGRMVFTDSYHVEAQLAYLPSCVMALMKDPARVVNFVPDNKPLGTCVDEWSSQEYYFTAAEKGCLCLSASIIDHASINYAAMSAIFEFLAAGGQEAIAGPFNLQIEGISSFHGFNNACYEMPILEQCEYIIPNDDNNQIVSVEEAKENNYILNNCAGEADLTVSPKCKRKSTATWKRLKNVLSVAMLRKSPKSTQILAM